MQYAQGVSTYVQTTRGGISHVISAEWKTWKRYTALTAETPMVLQEVIVSIC